MKTIFESTDIGGITIKNRLVRSATQEGSADEHGNITPALLSIYETLAAGGVGAIITSMVGVDAHSNAFPQMIRAYASSFSSLFSELVGRVHGHDCKIIVQLAHCGAKAQPDDGGSPLAPSDLPVTPENPARAMTTGEIQSFVKDFAKAAAVCQEAGADGVQLHAAHGYLLSQFLSPFFNKRQDEYGGTIANRARIVFEVLGETRKLVGEDYPIFIKINADDLVSGGITPDECLWVCKELETMGINGIEVSCGVAMSRDSIPTPRISSEDEEGIFAKNALMIAEHVNVPVLSVGGYRTPGKIEEWLNKGDIAAVSLCRPLITEPGLPNRWAAGDSEKSRCVSCNKCFNTKNGFGCKVF